MSDPIRLTAREQSLMDAEQAAWAQRYTGAIDARDEFFAALQDYIDEQLAAVERELSPPAEQMQFDTDPARLGVKAQYWRAQKLFLTRLRDGFFWRATYDHRKAAIAQKYRGEADARQRAERRAATREAARDHPYKGTDRGDIPAREPIDF
jgi:hypothetical protein